MSFSQDSKPYLPTPLDKSNPFEITSQPMRHLDLDGMTVMVETEDPDPDVGMVLDLDPVTESPEEVKQVEEDLPWGNAPATASWGPLMEEVIVTLRSP